MKPLTKLILFACIGALVYISLFVIPVLIADIDVVYQSKDHTITYKETVKNTGRTVYTLKTSYATLAVTEYDYNRLANGDVCNVTQKRGKYTEWRTASIVCNGSALKGYTVVEYGTKL